MAENIVYKGADQLPLMEEVSGSTHAIVEDNGQLKRVPGDMLGGSKTARIFVDLEKCEPPILVDIQEPSSPVALSVDSFRNQNAGIATISNGTRVTFTGECENMTFDEAFDLVSSGKQIGVSFHTRIPQGKTIIDNETPLATDAEIPIEGMVACTMIPITYGGQRGLVMFIVDPIMGQWQWQWTPESLIGGCDIMVDGGGGET